MNKPTLTHTTQKTAALSITLLLAASILFANNTIALTEVLK